MFSTLTPEQEARTLHRADFHKANIDLHPHHIDAIFEKVCKVDPAVESVLYLTEEYRNQKAIEVWHEIVTVYNAFHKKAA